MTKSIVLSNKGGCGKSTFAYQILAPYMFEKSGKPCSVIDLDSANKEYEVYENSKILHAEHVEIGMVSPDFLLKGNDLIVDTGATELCGKALNAFSDFDLLRRFDWFFIPLTRGKQSSSSAIGTYVEIQTLCPGAKVCFVLSNCYPPSAYPLEMQFFKFLGDKKHVLSKRDADGDYDAIAENDPSATWISVPEMPDLYWSAEYGMTAYEIADKLQEWEGENDAAYDAYSAESSQEAKADFDLTAYRLRLAKHCHSLREKFLRKGIFEELRSLNV